MVKDNYYYFYKQHGMCTGCRQEKAFRNRTKCALCLWKDAERQRIRRKNMSPLQKQNAACNGNKSHRDLYYSRKAQGLCTICGKHKAVSGTTKCTECRTKYNRYMRELKHRNGTLPFELKGNGTYCSTCGKPVEISGNKLCKHCYDNSIKALKKTWGSNRNSTNPDSWYNKSFTFK